MTATPTLLPQRVRALMAVRELTVDQLAFRANLRAEAIREVLRGSEPSTRFVVNCARVLGVSAEYLRTGDGATGLLARPAYRELTRMLEGLDEARQDVLCLLFIQSIHHARRQPDAWAQPPGGKP